MTLLLSEPALTEYSLLACEYYDSKRHPTCANFRELGLEFFERKLTELIRNRAVPTILETGAGRSVFVEPTLHSLLSEGKFILQDASREMLEHSDSILSNIEKSLVSDARAIPLADNSADIVISALADPYNDEEFWSEVARLLKQGGDWILSTPSHDWATNFRSGKHSRNAEFATQSNGTVLVPSETYPPESLIESVANFGGRILEYHARLADDVEGILSRKIDLGENLPIIDCYHFRF